MILHSRRLALPLVAAVILFAAHSRADDKKDPPKEKAPAAKPRLSDQLAKRVSLDKPFEGKFGDAVKMLGERFDLPLVIDPSLDRAEAGMAACDAADKPVKLPRLVNVRLDTVLRLLCDQVDATFLVQPDYIKLVPVSVGLYESGGLKQPDLGDPTEDPGLLSPIELQKSKPLIKRALVTAAYKDRPLTEVIDDIAESTGATVVLSPEVGLVGQKPITVRFANTPVDAAVRTLCEMTDLGVIEDANVLLVTTRERAAARQKADEEKRKARTPALPFGLCGGIGIGPGGIGGLGGGVGGLGGAGVAPAPDVTAEIAELKKQNEQLRQQLDDIKRLLKK